MELAPAARTPEFQLPKLYTKDITAFSNQPTNVSFDHSTSGQVTVTMPTYGDLYTARALFNPTVRGVKLLFQTSDHGMPLGALPEPAAAAQLIGRLPDVAKASYMPGHVGVESKAACVSQIDIQATSSAAADRLRDLLVQKYGDARIFIFAPGIIA